MFPPTRLRKPYQCFCKYYSFTKAFFSRTTQKNIINGTQCKSAPWVVEIIISHGRKWKHLCGGALIHPNWVITAAHSFFRYDKGNKPFAPNNAYKVCIGSSKLCLGLQYTVCGIYHPSFEVAMNNKIVLNDIALIKLPWSVPNYIATPVTLATNKEESYYDKMAHIYGWGVTKYNEIHTKKFSPVLQEGSVYIGDNNTCNDITARVDSGKICIDCDLSASIACTGDSGGPLILKDKDGRNVLIGISSYGDPNYDDWDIYTRITSYIDWIDNMTNKNQQRRIYINELRNVNVTELSSTKMKNENGDLNEIKRVNCEIIHVGLVCAGHNSSRIIVTLFKSILYHRRNPIHFHLMVDKKADRILKFLFNSWKLPEVNITFYQAEDYVKLIEWIPNKHYSGVFGLLKLLFPQILSNTVSKIITLDTDVTVLTDIAKLWQEFSNFSAEQAIGLVENQSDWYFGKLWNNYKPWPAIQRGFNTGVMLLDINKLNEQNWTLLWRLTAAQYLGTYGSTGLADQDILNAIIKNNPKFLYRLPCFWNVQLGDNTLSGSCYQNIIDIKIIHWNSPRKFLVENKDGDVLRTLYQTFLEYNGNFLRASTFTCDNTSKSVLSLEKKVNDDECEILKQTQKKVWRTHLFITDFIYQPTLNGNDVTLATQLSFDRIQMIEQICNHWTGPASFTFYATDADVQFILNYIQSNEVLKFRKNIAYHIVYKDGDVYPVNYLRNIGLTNVNTPFVFLTDIDFLPMNGLYTSIKRYILELFTSSKNKKALVIPAFETQRYRFSFPQTKDQLLNMLDQSMLFTFRYHVWTKGHEPTNYTKWKTAIHPYKIDWQSDFEPYVVLPSNNTEVPLYDTRFVGFGWNKVSHIMELNALQYEFIVLPDCFTIHLPHAPSYDIAKFRHSITYRRCLKVFKDEFIRELKRKYSNTLEITVVPATTMN